MKTLIDIIESTAAVPQGPEGLTREEFERDLVEYTKYNLPAWSPNILNELQPRLVALAYCMGYGSGAGTRQFSDQFKGEMQRLSNASIVRLQEVLFPGNTPATTAFKQLSAYVNR